MKKALFVLGAVVLVLAGYFANRIAGELKAPSAAAARGTVTTVSNPTTTSVSDAIQKAFKTASPSVVYVNNVGVGTGSGVIVDSSGDIVTNDHVVSGEHSLRVTLANGSRYSAQLVATDPADDLAVIRIHASGLTAAHFAGSSAITPAQPVLAIGSPLGLKDTVTFGLISGINRTEQEPNGSYIPNAVQTSAPINPGNSGGALVDLSGDVVGIPTMVQTSTGEGTAAQNVGFAIPSTRVTYIVNQILTHGKVVNTDRPFLGIGLASAASGSGFGFGFSGPQQSVAGALIGQVRNGTPAAKAGLQAGDVITALNGQSITSDGGLLAALAHDKPGQTVKVQINRNGTTKTLKVTLGELPANDA